MHLLFATSIVPDGAPASGYEIANAAIIDALRRAGVRVTVLGFTWPGKPPPTLKTPSCSAPSTCAPTALRRCRKPPGLQGRASTGSPSRRSSCAPSAATRSAPRSKGRWAVRRLCAERGAVRRRLRGPVRRQALDLRRAQCRAPLGRGKCRGGGQPAPALPVPPRGAAAERQSSAGSATRRISSSRWPRKTAPRSASTHQASAALPLVTPASNHMLPPSGARSFATRADRHLDLAAEPHRPRLVPGRSGAASAGRFPHQDRRQHAVPTSRSPHPGVDFVGRVADANAFVRSAAVIPLISRAGTGVQLKTIETFELGLPSVATSRSLRGIGTVPGQLRRDRRSGRLRRALERAAKAARDVDGARLPSPPARRRSTRRSGSACERWACQAERASA